MKREIKGLETLNKDLTKLLRKYGISSVSVNCEIDGFEYHHEDKSINVSLVDTSENLGFVWFEEFVTRRFNYMPINSFMILLFHEIGHANTTIDTLDEYFTPKREKLYARMEEEYDDNAKCKSVFFEYFDSVEEIVATAWAVDYMKKHEVEIANLYYKIVKALNKFYKANNLTE